MNCPPRCIASIPKGLHLSAQGCEERATLGQRLPKATTPTGLRPFGTTGRARTNGTCLNPVGVGFFLFHFTQGSSFLATLGFAPESRWDSNRRARANAFEGGGEVKPKVYLETTISSLLTAWPSRDVVIAGQQQATRDWWETRRTDFQLFVSVPPLWSQSGLCACGQVCRHRSSARLSS
jgi:hypothetical protein